MAGLNTAYSKKEESNVYAALKELRSKLTDYAYLQYTATPQAPLLVHLADCVSPEFAVVLTPGKGYVGGKQFFPIDGNKDVVIEIAADEEPESKEPPLPDMIPDSLKEALHYYLIGVADGISKDEQNQSGEICRSMLIHPHSQQVTHQRFYDIAKNYAEHIQGVLRSNDQQEKDEMCEELEPAYKQLKKTYPQINTLDNILNALPAAIEEMKSGMLIVNAKNKETISWKNYANVLIGGEVLGVGFTVKGLTVSYMLRTSQKGQIDSMQQRARFFGYRENDMGLTRVYLSADTHKSFRDYVRHEENTRESLIDMEKAGKSLKQWRRNFLVSSGKQLTRKSIQSLATLRSDSKKSNHPQHPWLVSEEQNNIHLELLKKVQSDYGLQRDKDCKRIWTESQQHLAAYVPADKFIDDIIASFSWIDENDSARWISAYYLLRVLAKEAADENRPLKLKVMVMRPISFGSGERGVTAGSWELLQGRSGEYPGDKKLADPDYTTIQLHCYNFVDRKDGKILGTNIVVPMIIPGKADQQSMQLITQNG
jgi:translation initiation factor 2B subunit (eIF-2B alpha/beta/delta family)